jgi:ATP-dependent Lon protease
MAVATRIPLFPLGVVLFPEVLLPLHIFEERYKEMIRECLEEDRAFGVVYYNGEEMKSKGCTARIIRLLRQYPDGRMDILTQGERRFEIEDLYEERAYMESSVHFFDDQEERETEATEALAREGLDLLMQIEDIASKQIAHDLGDKIGLKVASYLVASCEGFTAEEKQAFLEMTSSRDRLEKGVRSLRRILERVELTKQIKQIISGNGHVLKLAERLE